MAARSCTRNEPLSSQYQFPLPPFALRLPPLLRDFGAAGPSTSRLYNSCPTTPTQLSPSSCSSSPHSASPRFMDPASAAKFQLVSNCAKKQFSAHSLLVPNDTTWEIFNYFAPRLSQITRSKSLDSLSKTKESITPEASSGPKKPNGFFDIFDFEWWMERERLFLIQSEQALQPLGCPLKKSHIQQLADIIEKERQRVQHAKIQGELISKTINSHPVKLLILNGSFARFFFPKAETGTGLSKQVFPLWNLEPPYKEAILIAEGYEESTINELNFLLQLQGKRHTVPLFETFESSTHRFFVEPYYTNTFYDTLNLILDKRRTSGISAYDDQSKQNLIFQLLDAVDYLHEQHMLHRDIKPENILINQKGNKLVLCDFGLSCSVNDSPAMKENPGTPPYNAPECLRKEKTASYASDVWSVGIHLWMIFAEELPDWLPHLWENSRNYTLAFQAMDAFLIKLQSTKTRDPLYTLFREIFDQDPSKRPTISSIITRLTAIFEKPSKRSIFRRMHPIPKKSHRRKLHSRSKSLRATKTLSTKIDRRNES